MNSQVVVGDGGGTEGRGKACELVGQVVDTGATRLIWEYPNQHAKQLSDYSLHVNSQVIALHT